MLLGLLFDTALSRRWRPQSASGALTTLLMTATPLKFFKAENEMIPLGQLLFDGVEGNWEGLYTLVPGSPGEIYPLLTLSPGLLLCLGRIAAWRTPLAFLPAFGITTLSTSRLFSTFTIALDAFVRTPFSNTMYSKQRSPSFCF